MLHPLACHPDFVLQHICPPETTLLALLTLLTLLLALRTRSTVPSLAWKAGSHTSSTTAVTSTGDLIGYRTTYSATNRPLEAKLQTAAATQRPSSCPEGVERLRMAVG